MSLVEKFAEDLTDRLLNERSPEKAVDIVSFETENVGKLSEKAYHDMPFIFPQYSCFLSSSFSPLFL